jgi:hypothetical protein
MGVSKSTGKADSLITLFLGMFSKEILIGYKRRDYKIGDEKPPNTCGP